MGTPTSPPPPPQTKDQSSDYYYFVIAIAAVAILLLASNIIAVGCCSRCRLYQAVLRFLRSRGVLSGIDEDDQISQLIPACKYKKEQAPDSECSVCLSVFADGEEIRQLPKCKHSFHAPCIDMWLYSHANCPMCRASVLLEPLQCQRAAAREDARQQNLMESGSFAGVVVGML